MQDLEAETWLWQGGTRPVVVLQNDVGNRYMRPTLLSWRLVSFPHEEIKRYQAHTRLIAHNTGL